MWNGKISKIWREKAFDPWEKKSFQRIMRRYSSSLACILEAVSNFPLVCVGLQTHTHSLLCWKHFWAVPNFMLELEAPPLGGKKKRESVWEKANGGSFWWKRGLHLRKRMHQWSAGSQGSAWRGSCSTERGGEGSRRGRWAGEQVLKTQRYLAANSSALPESWQRVPYLLDNTQLQWFPE